MADAALLGISHGVDGARADHGHLSGSVQQIPARPRHQRHEQFACLVLHRRRRDRRTGNARRHYAGLARKSRQPDFRHQLQSPAARWSGARQRQDHPGIGRHLPRRRLECAQSAVGRRLGRIARARQDRPACQADGRGDRRRVSKIQRHARLLYPPAFLRQVSRIARIGQPSVGREAQEAAPRRTRSGKGLRGLSGGRRMQGTADLHPGKNDQGLRARRNRRRPQRDASTKEAERRRAARVPLAIRHSDFRRGSGQSAVLPPGRRHPGDEVSARAAAKPWAVMFPAGQ